jgi:hypothetical protein
MVKIDLDSRLNQWIFCESINQAYGGYLVRKEKKDDHQPSFLLRRCGKNMTTEARAMLDT